MKKFAAIGVLLMLLNISAFAVKDHSSPAQGMVVVKSGSTYKLHYKGEKRADVSVTITDSNNKIVFRETLKDVEGFTRPYNVSNLPEGDYKIELTSAHTRYVETITNKVNNTKVEKLAHLIHLNTEEGRYMIMVPNKDKVILTVSIYDESGKTLLQQSEKTNTDFAKVYNLKSVKGNIYINVSDSNGIIKTFRL